MSLFSKSYSINTLAKLAIDQWNKKINSEPDKKKLILDVDIQGLEMISMAVGNSDTDKYDRWLVNEVKLAIHNDLSRVMFMGSISSCLAHLNEKTTPKELLNLSASEMFQAVYIAGLKELGLQPLIPTQSMSSEPDLQQLQPISETPFVETLSAVSQSFNLMIANEYTREQILEEHFYKHFSYLNIKGAFAPTPTNGDSYDEFIKYQQEDNGITFVAGFKMGDFSTTAEFASACVFVQYYLDLLFDFKDNEGNYFFPDIVNAKDSGNSKQLSQQMSELNVYTVVKTISPYIAGVIEGIGIENRQLYDRKVVIRQLGRAHKAFAFDDADLIAIGIDVDILSEIILALNKSSLDYEIFAGEPHHNFIRVRGRISVNIFGARLPLQLDNVVGSYDSEKAMTKEFGETITDINKSSKYGKWTIDHIHDIDDNGEELETYSETIVNNVTVLNNFTTGMQFIKFLEARAAEISKLKSLLTKYERNYFSSDADLFHKACELVIANQKASTTMLQKEFRISYARAVRLMTELSDRDIVKIQGNQPATVLVKSIDECP